MLMWRNYADAAGASDLPHHATQMARNNYHSAEARLISPWPKW